VRAGGEGAILLAEVAPVITVGRRTPTTDIHALLSQEQSDECVSDILSGALERGRSDRREESRMGMSGSAPLYPVSRGGLATYHGPGQWVLFVVDDLERLTGHRTGVRRMICSLLQVAKDVGQGIRPDSNIHVREGAEQGVWSARGKFAAVGIQIDRKVVQHGLSINGFRTPESFQGLRPCGLDAPVDFLLSSAEGFEELGRRILRVAEGRFRSMNHEVCSNFVGVGVAGSNRFSASGAGRI
jgi:lipoate-protein ligase B